ncbi:MAG TPA: ATPase V [Enterococcus columbae]|nr:ATPase V [Enterococcus columbae]
MSAIDKIIAKIDEQAALELQNYENTELAQINQSYEQQLAQLEQDKARQLAKQTETIEKKYKQLHNRQEVEARQAVLNEKQYYLEKLFVAASNQMSQWSKAEMTQFASDALATLSLSGKVQFIPGELSKAALDQEWLAKMNQQLPFELVYSSKTIVNQAGFIVDDQGVQYNFIFENLIKDIQASMSFELANRLFG